MKVGATASCLAAFQLLLFSGCSFGTSSTGLTATTSTGAATTTFPKPAPVFRLWGSDSASEKKFRFDPCKGPIEILLNGGALPEFRHAQIGRFLQDQANELTRHTGIQFTYAGTTDLSVKRNLEEDALILIEFGGSDGGLLESDMFIDQFRVTHRTSKGWTETVSFQIYFDVEADPVSFDFTDFTAWFFEDASDLKPESKRLIMAMLGQAVGLDVMDDEFMKSNGVPNQQRQGNVMYSGDYWYGERPITWGDGDQLGLFQVGSSNGCF